MKYITSLLCVFVAALAVNTVAADEEFRPIFSPVHPNDDVNTRGLLFLDVEDNPDTTDGDDIRTAIEFQSILYNAIQVTAVHLHLQGVESAGVYGGPLLRVLADTEATPVSSSGDQPLLQAGYRNATDLQNAPQRQQVEARLADSGMAVGAPNDSLELINLIRMGVVYADVHTVDLQSPDGLTRGPIVEEESDDDFPSTDDGPIVTLG